MNAKPRTLFVVHVTRLACTVLQFWTFVLPPNMENLWPQRTMDSDSCRRVASLTWPWPHSGPQCRERIGLVTHKPRPPGAAPPHPGSAACKAHLGWSEVRVVPVRVRRAGPDGSVASRCPGRPPDPSAPVAAGPGLELRRVGLTD